MANIRKSIGTVIMITLALLVTQMWAVQADEVQVSDAPELAKLSVRDRLKLAADVSDELSKKAQSSDPEFLKQVALRSGSNINDETKNGPIFPMTEHIRQYEIVRPWSTLYVDIWHSGSISPWSAQLWPDLIDAPELRRLIQDSDPKIRSLAAESLATLHQPEDIPLIAALLDDSAKGPACLKRNRQESVLVIPGVRISSGTSKVEILRSWDKIQVKDYVKCALEYMTGKKFDSKAFPAWWEKNKDARNHYWYWKQRINCDQNVAEQIFIHELASGPSGFNYDKAQACSENSSRASLQNILAELHELSPEMESKVVLIADIECSRGRQLFSDSDIIALSISRSRLLDLMEYKEPWDEVDWRMCYQPFVRRLALLSDKLFAPEDVERLRALLSKKFSEYCCYQLEIGISRLLPPATGDLDTPNTRDGELRAAINRAKKSELIPDAIVCRGHLAAELVRVGLPRNLEYVKELFFSEPEGSFCLELRDAILYALGKAPLTSAKRNALLDLVLDARYTPLWTRNILSPDGRYRDTAARSLNAHAGYKLITSEDIIDLVQKDTSERTLETVIGKIRDWAQ